MIRCAAFLLLVFASAICRGQSPEVVTRVTEINLQTLLSDPPHLLVTAKGLVPSGGFTDTRLLRARYVQAPQDGIQDYFLVSTPPPGSAASEITEVTAADQIERFTTELPWLKGVRVHGTGTGVMTKMLGTNLRVRKNVLDLTPAELDVFKQGVQVMKSRPASDPRSWSFQANIHGENTPASNALWNQCQHGTLQFFTWHRAYLLEFERILRDASGNDSFDLPYWDWSTARSLPAAFRDPASPLFEPGRSINLGQLLPVSVVVDDLASTIGDISFNDFSFGFEGSPHGAVHVLIGGRMSSVPTAANDPIFWLHHCQIDRVWDSWISLGGGRANPSDPNFLNRTFSLAGQTGATVTHRVADLLDSSALGYRYADLSGSSPTPSTPTSPRPTTMIALHQGSEDHDNEAALVASSIPPRGIVGAQNVATAKALGLKVERVELEPRAEMQPRMRAAVKSASSASTERIYVDVVGLKTKETPRFAYTVYLNLPTEPVAEEVKKLYRISTINFFGLTEKTAEQGHAHGAAGSSKENRQRFDATRTVARLREAGLWKEGKISITLEPLTPVSTKSEDSDLAKLLAESAENSKITYERIDISIIAR